MERFRFVSFQKKLVDGMIFKVDEQIVTEIERLVTIPSYHAQGFKALEVLKK